MVVAQAWAGPPHPAQPPIGCGPASTPCARGSLNVSGVAVRCRSAL